MTFPDSPSNPTTVTIGSGETYTSIGAWQTSVSNKDLVTLQASYILELKAESITEDATSIAGWTMNSNYFILIRPVSGGEHNGVVGAGPILTDSVGFNAPLDSTDDYVAIYGIEFRNTIGSNGDGFSYTSNTALHLENCIANGCSRSGFAGLNGSTTLVNCLALDCGTTGFLCSGTGPGTFINCLSIDCTTGFSGPTSVNDAIAKNCCAYGGTTRYANRWDSTNSTNNAASDAETNTPPGSNPITTNIVSTDFEDYANDDYHLASGSTLIAAGADLTASGYTTDWEGDPRPNGSAWDIGPDQIAASIQITDVANSGETPGSGSESWEDGSTGNVITGSGFV